MSTPTPTPLPPPGRLPHTEYPRRPRLRINWADPAAVGAVSRGAEPLPRLRNVADNPHNFLRISRLVRCLGELGCATRAPNSNWASRTDTLLTMPAPAGWTYGSCRCCGR